MKCSKSKIIGLTGGIATGKSTVSAILKRQGYRIIDADRLARLVVQVNKPAYEKLVERFGSKILNKDKTINRQLLGDIVFSNKELLTILNEITHPYIYEEIKKEIGNRLEKESIVFIDIPLLFEEMDKIRNHNIILDEIWLIYVDEETQLKRLMERNKLATREAKSRIDLQMPIEEKKSMATRIIDNSKSISFLEEQISEILSQI